MTNLQTSLQITLYGMGLVFIGILLLWAMMAILVKVFADHRSKTEEELHQDLPDELENKRLAAAIAVSIAMEMHNTAILTSSHKERESLSAWQAAHRSLQMNHRHFISSKKR